MIENLSPRATLLIGTLWGFLFCPIFVALTTGLWLVERLLVTAIGGALLGFFGALGGLKFSARYRRKNLN